MNDIPDILPHLTYEDGIPHTLVDGALVPVWTTDLISVDPEHRLVSWRVDDHIIDETVFVHGSTGGDYLSDNDIGDLDVRDACLEAAKSIQDHWKARGVFVPIYVRD